MLTVVLFTLVVNLVGKKFQLFEIRYYNLNIDHGITYNESQLKKYGLKI